MTRLPGAAGHGGNAPGRPSCTVVTEPRAARLAEVTGSILFAKIVGVARTLEALGVPEDRLVSTIGRPLVVDDPDERVGIELYFQLYELGYEVTGRRDLGLAVAVNAGGIERLGVVGFMIKTAPDGITACQRAARYLRVAIDMGAEWRVELEADQVRISFEIGVRDRLSQQLAIEASIASFVSDYRRISRQDMRPTTVRFPHPGPTNDLGFRTFFGCPVEFGTGKCDFVFDRAFNERAAMPDADLAMNEFFARYADRMLESNVRSIQTVAERAADHLRRHLVDGEPTSESTAKALGMSSRSLRRSLEREGTSFRQLLDEVRLERAKGLLGQENITASEVAFLVGFGDLTAFSRAFKRWTGTSPREFRLRLAS